MPVEGSRYLSQQALDAAAADVESKSADHRHGHSRQARDSTGGDIAGEVLRLTGGAGADLGTRVGRRRLPRLAGLAATRRVTGRVVVYGVAGGEAAITNCGVVVGLNFAGDHGRGDRQVGPNPIRRWSQNSFPEPEALASAELTYRELGATREGLPPGYQHLSRDASMGTGPVMFGRAVEALFGWRMHQGAGLAVAASKPAAAPDDVRLRITAFSRPASLAARAGGALTRRAQSLITDRYISALQRLARPHE